MLRPRHFFTLRAEQSLVRCPGKPSGPGHQKAHHAAHQSRAKTKQLLAVPQHSADRSPQRRGRIVIICDDSGRRHIASNAAEISAQYPTGRTGLPLLLHPLKSYPIATFRARRSSQQQLRRRSCSLEEKN